MRKSKGQTIDSFYTNKETSKKTKKVNTTNKKTKKGKAKKKQNEENSKIINLDNEIIIGLTPKKEENKNTKSQKNKKNSHHEKNKSAKRNVVTTKNNSNKKSVKKTSNKSKKKNKIIKYLILILLLIILIILFMMSSLFNIKEIKVVNNNKIQSEEIINLSTLKINNNMFKTTNKIIRNNVKTNAYIENVKIKRSINGVVTLDITERKPTYMLKFANAYVYINNQGYMLEMSETPLELPTITGFETPTEEIKEGNRLIVEDLKKLEDVIKIMNAISENTLSATIDNIDITDKTNYKLTINSENKIINFGEATNINVKLLKIEEIIQKEKGKEGEIYFQNSEKTVFKEKV